MVEKILAADEKLPADWDIAGTTGYDFLAEVGALLHDAGGVETLRALWTREGSRDPVVPRGGARRARANACVQLSERARGAGQCRQESCAARSSRAGLFQGSDRARVDGATSGNADVPDLFARPGLERSRGAHDGGPLGARRRDDPSAGSSDLRQPASVARGAISRRRCERAGFFEARRRFEQLSSPLAAKSVEDTAFYRHGPLLSLNEVGSRPDYPIVSIARFHEICEARSREQPASMLATATHDHKRGEDARARLAVLSETPDAWASFLRRAESIAEPWIGVAGDDGALPRSDFNMLAQTIVGAWPLSLSPRDAEGLLAFQERIVGWQTKSLREAKLQTSWHVPDVAYEERWIEVVKALLAEGSAFTEFAREMVDAIAPAGAINGLAQTLLRLTAPGVPDLYQGGEFWDFSLVDPDNRRPIDFAARRAALADELRFEDSAETWTDGRIKQRLIARVLNFRKRDPELFSRGSYEPIAAAGRFRDFVVAYLRRHETRIALVVVARHSFALRPSGACLGIDPAGWADTRLDLGSLGPLRSLLDDGSIDAAGPAALSKVLRSGSRGCLRFREMIAIGWASGRFASFAARKWRSRRG